MLRLAVERRDDSVLVGSEDKGSEFAGDRFDAFEGIGHAGRKFNFCHDKKS